MPQATEIKRGDILDMDGAPWLVNDVHSQTPSARGASMLVKVKVKNKDRDKVKDKVKEKPVVPVRAAVKARVLATRTNPLKCSRNLNASRIYHQEPLRWLPWNYQH